MKEKRKKERKQERKGRLRLQQWKRTSARTDITTPFSNKVDNKAIYFSFVPPESLRGVCDFLVGFWGSVTVVMTWLKLWNSRNKQTILNIGSSSKVKILMIYGHWQAITIYSYGLVEDNTWLLPIFSFIFNFRIKVNLAKLFN